MLLAGVSDDLEFGGVEREQRASVNVGGGELATVRRRESVGNGYEPFHHLLAGPRQYRTRVKLRIQIKLFNNICAGKSKISLNYIKIALFMCIFRSVRIINKIT